MLGDLADFDNMSEDGGEANNEEFRETRLGSPPPALDFHDERPISRNGQQYQSLDATSSMASPIKTLSPRYERALGPPQLASRAVTCVEHQADFLVRGVIKAEIGRKEAAKSPHRPHSVMESAFERHMASLEKVVEHEVQHAMDIHQHHMKDMDEIALEKKKKRQNAEKLQEYIRDQMLETQKAKEIEKREKNGLNPEENTIISHSQHSRLGFNSTETNKKNKSNLSKYLEEQVCFYIKYCGTCPYSCLTLSTLDPGKGEKEKRNSPTMHVRRSSIPG